MILEVVNLVVDQPLLYSETFVETLVGSVVQIDFLSPLSDSTYCFLHRALVSDPLSAILTPQRLYHRSLRLISLQRSTNVLGLLHIKVARYRRFSGILISP